MAHPPTAGLADPHAADTRDLKKASNSCSAVQGTGAAALLFAETIPKSTVEAYGRHWTLMLQSRRAFRLRVAVSSYLARAISGAEEEVGVCQSTIQLPRVVYARSAV